MKKTLLILFVIVFAGIQGDAQVFPEWTRSMTNAPDSGYLSPVKSIGDNAGNIIVLSTYFRIDTAGNITNKISVNKFDQDGVLLWNVVFDNGGVDNPRGFDIASDANGSIYVAGGLMTNVSLPPFLLKISSGGIIIWQQTGTINFTSGWFEQIIVRYDRIYLRSSNGLAVFAANGNEVWSHASFPLCMALDSYTRIIVTSSVSADSTLICYDSLGVVQFADSTMHGNKISIDNKNNIILLNDFPQYELGKFDSTGALLWYRISPPNPLPFGDGSYEVLTDHDENVIAIGLNNQIFKYDPLGNLLWQQSMNGLDDYSISTKIVYSNFIAVTGSIQGFGGYDVMVVLINDLGDVVYSGICNSTTDREFAISMHIDNSGIYVLEDSAYNSMLIKFATPLFSDVVDFNFVCVDSVWYEPGDSSFVNIRIFNGNINHMNYPAVKIATSAGDTITDTPFSFFAHIGNRYQTYQDSIFVNGISDFHDYSFFIEESFGDTIARIYFCNSTGIQSPEREKLILYPNPVTDNLYFKFQEDNIDFTLEVFDNNGRCVKKQKADENFSSVNVSDLSSGIYIMRIVTKNSIYHHRFIKQ